MFQVLVHGEQTGMGRLRAALQARYKNRGEEVKIHTPRNLETLKLTFRGERVAKVRSSVPQTLQRECNLILMFQHGKRRSYSTGHRKFGRKTTESERYILRVARSQGLLVHTT